MMTSVAISGITRTASDVTNPSTLIAIAANKSKGSAKCKQMKDDYFIFPLHGNC